jgi:predicted nucleic acid-binding protein
MIFLEAIFLVSYYVEKDKHHRKAEEIVNRYNHEDKVISKMVIFEVLTVLRKLNQTDDEVKKAYNNLINMIIIDDTLSYNQALSDCLINNIGFLIIYIMF